MIICYLELIWLEIHVIELVFCEPEVSNPDNAELGKSYTS